MTEPAGVSASVLDALAAAERLLVCCDFDGTISELAYVPSAARPVEGAIEALEALARIDRTWVALVSGRALAELRQLTGEPRGVQLVGSHGAEFADGTIVGRGGDSARLLATVAARCEALAAGVDGALVEVKTASVAVHVRLAEPTRGEALLAAVRHGPGSLPGVHALDGKQVVELALFDRTKADGVRDLREQWSATTVLFVGDDRTDEFAFAELGPCDVGVKVGPETSAAPFRATGPGDVVAFFGRLASLRAQRVAS